jgi:hypothetical protein
MKVDTLGKLLALHVTPASDEDRGEVERLVRAAQTLTSDNVGIAYVDQGYTGMRATDAAAAHGIKLEIVKLPEAKRGFVLGPGDRSPNVRSPGQPAFAASSKTMSAMHKHS